uniref:Uncharacterized protein LOC105122685 n=1 Tax=Rhizophora mucronata TaxID=61149 RepID=A0A2P2QSD1_RHIMU
MDWFSWLSKTGLEPSLVYQYSLAFANNQLQAEDLAYFNHEFLQSMGISGAKHRLEILKLARKEDGAGSKGFSNLILAINRAKNTFRKLIGKMAFRQDSPITSVPEQLPWREAFPMKCKSETKLKVEKPPIPRCRGQAKSGPLNRGVREKSMPSDRSLKFSGPLDGKIREGLMLDYRSPMLQRNPDGKLPKTLVTSRNPQLLSPWDKAPASLKVYNKQSKGKTVNGDYDDHSLWSALFQDLKPT